MKKEKLKLAIDKYQDTWLLYGESIVFSKEGEVLAELHRIRISTENKFDGYILELNANTQYHSVQIAVSVLRSIVQSEGVIIIPELTEHSIYCLIEVNIGFFMIRNLIIDTLRLLYGINDHVDSDSFHKFEI